MNKLLPLFYNLDNQIITIETGRFDDLCIFYNQDSSLENPENWYYSNNSTARKPVKSLVNPKDKTVPLMIIASVLNKCLKDKEETEKTLENLTDEQVKHLNGNINYVNTIINSHNPEYNDVSCISKIINLFKKLVYALLSLYDYNRFGFIEKVDQTLIEKEMRKIENNERKKISDEI